VSIRRAGQRLVVLDLDGTITRSDTLIPFLAGCFVRYPRLRLVASHTNGSSPVCGWSIGAYGVQERLLTALSAGCGSPRWRAGLESLRDGSSIPGVSAKFYRL
jgi:hypothetical protein